MRPGVLVNKETGEAMLSGGLLIQVLPGADDKAVSRLEENVGKLESITTMLAKGMTVEEICRKALDGFEVEVLDQFQINYVCNCSKERFSNAMLTLGAKEIRELPLNEQGQAEAVCHYCNRKYYFTREELEVLARQAEESARKK